MEIENGENPNEAEVASLAQLKLVYTELLQIGGIHIQILRHETI